MKKNLLLSFVFILILSGCEFKLDFWNEPEPVFEPDPITNIPVNSDKDFVELQGTVELMGQDYYFSVTKKNVGNLSEVKLTGDTLDLLDPFIETNEVIRVYGVYDNDVLEVHDFSILQSGIVFMKEENLFLVNNRQAFKLKGKQASDLSQFEGLCVDVWGIWKFQENGDFLVKSFDVVCPIEQKYLTYTNDEFLFTIRYPFDWQYEEETIDLDDEQKAFNILFKGTSEQTKIIIQKEIPRISLEPYKIKRLEIKNIKEANLFIDNDSDKVIFDLPDSEYDFYFEGRGDIFNVMSNTIEIIKKSDAISNVDFTCESDLDCITSGCSGQVCQHKDKPSAITTCEYKPEFSCYKSSGCICRNNKCSWSNEILSCIEKHLQQD